MSRKTEIAHYTRMVREHCGRNPSNCPGERRELCGSIRQLLKRLQGSKDASAAKDRLRDAVYHLDRCRVRSGERLAFYGIGR